MSKIINFLESLINKEGEQIEEWLALKRAKKQPSIYSSVDLRHSGFKLAPVDTNLFPAGFNNLSQAAKARAVRFFSARFLEMTPAPKKILIVPENHTRNLGYLENLLVLSGLLEQAGMEVKIGNISITEKLELTTMSGGIITEYPLEKSNGMIATLDGFQPDLVILNNDCTSGAPQILENIKQPIEPNYQMGWYARRKSEHFRAFDEIAREFAAEFNFDSWLISPISHRCGIVNFRESKGIECVALGVEKVIHQLKRKYEEYGITEKPYAYIKADSGTYGMGIMTVESGDELLEINKKTRNKMNVIKEGTQNTEVIIQEGIPTIDKVDGSSAESMIYLVDAIPVGGAYRVNDERDNLSNLNASGMRFVGMCDESECDEVAKTKIKIPDCNFHVFGLIATLATLAASDEVYNSFDIGFSI
ncbi:MAG: glutamate--cysteine ligase [Pseudomonadota bacterium]